MQREVACWAENLKGWGCNWHFPTQKSNPKFVLNFNQLIILDESMECTSQGGHTGGSSRPLASSAGAPPPPPPAVARANHLGWIREAPISGEGGHSLLCYITTFVERVFLWGYLLPHLDFGEPFKQKKKKKQTSSNIQHPVSNQKRNPTLFQMMLNYL